MYFFYQLSLWTDTKDGMSLLTRLGDDLPLLLSSSPNQKEAVTVAARPLVVMEPSPRRRRHESSVAAPRHREANQHVDEKKELGVHPQKLRRTTL
jgi:hypothetical protein